MKLWMATSGLALGGVRVAKAIEVLHRVFVIVAEKAGGVGSKVRFDFARGGVEVF